MNRFSVYRNFNHRKLYRNLYHQCCKCEREGYDFNYDGFNYDCFNYDCFNYDCFNYDCFKYDGFNHDGLNHDCFDYDKSNHDKIEKSNHPNSNQTKDFEYNLEKEESGNYILQSWLSNFPIYKNKQ